MRSTIHTNLKINDNCSLRCRISFGNNCLFLLCSLLLLLLLGLLLLFFWHFFLLLLSFHLLLLFWHNYFIYQISNISCFLNNTLNFAAISFLFSCSTLTCSSSFWIFCLTLFSLSELKVDYPKVILFVNFVFLLSNNSLWRVNCKS